MKSLTGSRERQLATVTTLPLVEKTPDPPRWLTKPNAKAEWRRLAPILVQNKRLTEASVSAFGLLCSLHAQVIDEAKSGRTNASLSGQYIKLLDMFGVVQGTPTGPEPPKGNRFAGNGRRP